MNILSCFLSMSVISTIVAGSIMVVVGNGTVGLTFLLSTWTSFVFWIFLYLSFPSPSLVLQYLMLETQDYSLWGWSSLLLLICLFYGISTILTSSAAVGGVLNAPVKICKAWSCMSNFSRSISTVDS